MWSIGSLFQFKISFGNILGLLTRACGSRTRDISFKLTESRLRLVVRKKSFIQRVVRHWHRLPRDVGDVPSLELFKATLDGGGLGNIVGNTTVNLWNISDPAMSLLPRAFK